MNKERLMEVLLSPIVSEKSYSVADLGPAKQVVFKVLPTACKEEIKAAVELMFDVKVDSVRTVNVAGKARRFGKFSGRRQDWKKAYVRLASGHDINFFTDKQ
ncbi:MAG: 50S ribosomal protein L23 [Gammaproteobacteria bacterium]|nr:50S ribosomal protein L23 [Gammaproteobacteria bacterium]